LLSSIFLRAVKERLLKQMVFRLIVRVLLLLRVRAQRQPLRQHHFSGKSGLQEVALGAMSLPELVEQLQHIKQAI
jgi:hypothetical protein